MAWLTNWNRRKQLYINGTGNNQYQMKITVYYGTGTDTPGNIYCGGNVWNDFRDIRFTDSTGGPTTLNYWIDPGTYTSGVKTDIWVQIPSIPAGSNSANIYIYYNNPSASSLSNGTNTFLFFDDISGSTYTNKWTLNDIACNATVSEGSGLLTQNVPGGGAGFTDSGSTLSATGVSLGNNIEYYIRIPTLSYYSGGWSAYRLFLNASGSWAAYDWCKPNRTGPSNGFDIEPGYNGSNQTTQFYVYNISNSTKTQVAFKTGLALTNYILRVTYNAPNFILYTSTDGVTWTQQLSWSGAPTITGTITSMFNGCCDRASKLQYSFFRVRNYASTEPTWSSTISAEQNVTLNITSTPTGAEIWLRSPQGTGNYIDQGIQTNTYTGVAPGTYDIKITKLGYQDWYLLNQTFTALYSYLIPATLSLLPGSLNITSVPSGAEIWIAGVDRGVTTPATISNLNPSPPDYNITLKLANYADWTGSATVNTNATTFVTATFAGSASITSTPTNAAVYLDGSPSTIGNTTIIITNLTNQTSDGSRPTQSHNYILKLTGYADTSGSFTATAGSTINVPVIFQGSLYITSIPVGATIYIDGVQQ